MGYVEHVRPGWRFWEEEKLHEKRPFISCKVIDEFREAGSGGNSKLAASQPWRIWHDEASQALANANKVGYTRLQRGGKMPKNGKIGLCLANDLAKPLLEPCEAARSGKDVGRASAIETH
jgi:hypothetical protein